MNSDKETPSMGGIFVSYRREDSAGHAGRLFDRLKESFGKDRVFMDVAGIEPGIDFVEAIDSAVGSCDVLIVVIGRKWLDCTDAAGRRRLDDPKDFIRLETATALRRNIRVIPALVQGATMPGAENLSEDLQKLSRRQAIEVSDTHWDSDVDQLIETLGKAVEKPGPSISSIDVSGPSDKTGNMLILKRPTALLMSIVAILVVIGAGVAYYLYQKANQIPVPNVVGMTKADAVARLRGVGFFSWVERLEESDEPPGMVIRQEPYPGTKISPTGAVSLVVTQGVKVPNVVGETLEKAAMLLNEAGLTEGEKDKKQSAEVSPGSILDQAPEAGTEVRRRSKVRLLVAVRPEGMTVVTEPTQPESITALPKPLKPEIVTVPSVLGMTKAEAADRLKRVGLRVGRTQSQESDKRPGTVLDQKPEPGSQLAQQQQVDLLIAKEFSVVTSPGSTQKDVVNYFNQGLTSYRNKKFDEAMDSFQKAIELNPKYAPAYSGLGDVARAQGKYDEAMKYYQKAIELNPKDFMLFMKLGSISGSQKKPDEAARWYQRAIDLEPKFVPAYRSLGDVFYEQKRYDEAMRSYQKAMELDPKDPQALVRIGNVLLAQRRQDEAVKYYQRAIDLNPRGVPTSVFYDLGKILTGRKRYDEALRYYKTAAERDPKNPTAYLNLAFTLHNLKRDDEAMRNCQKAKELNPKINRCW
jgi:tetratricopeptide (TPR) repeat protein